MTGKFGSHSLLYTATVAGCDPRIYDASNPHPSMFMLAQTRQMFPQFGDNIPFDRICQPKFLKWWTTGHCCGIKTVVAGLKTNDDVIRFKKAFRVEQLPYAAKGAKVRIVS